MSFISAYISQILTVVDRCRWPRLLHIVVTENAAGDVRRSVDQHGCRWSRAGGPELPHHYIPLWLLLFLWPDIWLVIGYQFDVKLATVVRQPLLLSQIFTQLLGVNGACGDVICVTVLTWSKGDRVLVGDMGQLSVEVIILRSFGKKMEVWDATNSQSLFVTEWVWFKKKKKKDLGCVWNCSLSLYRIVIAISTNTVTLCQFRAWNQCCDQTKKIKKKKKVLVQISPSFEQPKVVQKVVQPLNFFIINLSLTDEWTLTISSSGIQIKHEVPPQF